MNFQEYGVLQGLKHMRYDYEDSAEFMNRMWPNLMEMHTSMAQDRYKWQESNPMPFIPTNL